MARPTKDGVDYFPLECHMSDKMKLIEAEFGLKGFAVVVKLYQKIYGERGYYCEWNEEVALLFGRSCGLGGSAVSEIVNACAKRKLFDYELLEKYGILTSKGIQERFLEMTARRKANAIKQEYLLVKAEPCPNSVYADNNAVNVCNNPENVCNNTQSKVKESNTTTTTTTNQSIAPPSVTEVALYMRELGVGDSLVYGGDPSYEADKFVAYNAKRNWDSMPEWKKAADLWVSRIKERSRQ